MSDFAHTFDQLRNEHLGVLYAFMVSALLLLGAWLAWAVLAQITLNESTSEARLELDAATYPLDAPFSGRVVASALQVGAEVHRGDLLIELDSTPQRLELREQEVRRQGLEPQIARLRAQMDAERAARGEEGHSTSLGAAEAASRVSEAEATAQMAANNLGRARALFKQDILSAQDMERAESESVRTAANVAALRAAANRVVLDQTAHDRNRDVRLARLQGEIAGLEAQRDSLAAGIDRLAYEIERCQIRAATGGHVGEAATIRPGAVVAEGQRLASIVPQGRLRVVALYPAAEAFGRIRIGAAATLRLDGFPWAEFGTVTATVDAVAQEVRDGKVRIELGLTGTRDFHGRLQHGMPGTLEIITERISPLELVLRTAGQWLSEPV